MNEQEYVDTLYKIMDAISRKQWPVEFDRTAAGIAILQEIGKDHRTPGYKPEAPKKDEAPKPMSPGQHDFLHRHEIPHDDKWTFAQAWDVIDAKVKSWG